MAYQALLAFLCALFAAAPALAQATVLQGGPTTPAHVPIYSNGGNTQPIIQDGGGSGGVSSNGFGNPSELGITSRSPSNIYPSANSGHGPRGEHLCMYDGPTTNANGFHYLCMEPNAAGGGLIDYGARGAAIQLPLTISVNGVTAQFPFSSAITGAPNSVAGFNGAGAFTSFTTLPSGVTVLASNLAVGAAAANGAFPYAHTRAALAALSTATPGYGSVIEDGYDTVGDMPATWYVGRATCPYTTGVDGGGCIASADSKFWVITIAPYYDPRIWHAKCDGSTDDTTSINTTLTFVGAISATMLVPELHCRNATGTIVAPVNANVLGASYNTANISAAGDVSIGVPVGSVFQCGLNVTPCFTVDAPTTGSTLSSSSTLGGQSIERISIVRDVGAIPAGSACFFDRSFRTTVRDVNCNGHAIAFERFGVTIYGLDSVYDNVSTMNICDTDLVSSGNAVWKVVHSFFGGNGTRCATHNNYVSITGGGSSGTSYAPGPNTLTLMDDQFNDSINPTCWLNFNNLTNVLTDAVIEFRAIGNHLEFTGQAGSPHYVLCADASAALNGPINTFKIVDNDITDFNGTSQFARLDPAVGFQTFILQGNAWSGFETNGWVFNPGQPIYDMKVDDLWNGPQVTINGPSLVGSATVTSGAGGTGYGASATGTMTWNGAGCTINPVLNVTTNSSGVITTVNSVANGGLCPSLPSQTAATWTAGGGLSAGTGAEFTLSPFGASAVDFRGSLAINNPANNALVISGSFASIRYGGAIRSGKLSTTSLLTPSNAICEFASACVWATYNPTVTCSTSGAPTYTATGSFWPVGKAVTYSFDVVITAAGTCVGTPVVTMPEAPLTSVALMGRDVNTGFIWAFQGSAGVPFGALSRYDDVSVLPGSNTAHYVFTGQTYQAQ